MATFNNNKNLNQFPTVVPHTEIQRLKERLRELESSNQQLEESNASKDEELRRLEEKMSLATSRAQELTLLLTSETAIGTKGETQ